MNTNVRVFLVTVALASAQRAQAQPTITGQPTNQSVSLGANAVFQISAKTTNPPLLFQWRFAETNLLSATNSTLTLTSVQLANAGDYDVVVTDRSASALSRIAHLEVDPTFTQITSSPIVTDSGGWFSCAWGDYDDDGFLDLFVTNTANPVNDSLRPNRLYHNNGNGTFTRITTVTTGAIVSEAGEYRACAWADFNNDGYLDLVVGNDINGSGFPEQVYLYRNKGDGTFAKMPASILGNRIPGGAAQGFAWADYDSDGFLDLYIARYGPDCLLHNNGDNTFTRITNNVGIPPDAQNTYSATWGDYDNDGWPDLCVADEPNLLYHNNGNGTFTKIVSGTLVTEEGDGIIWVDYDNDGFLDAFTAGGALYHNNGDLTFTKRTSLDGVAGAGGLTWGDYDNDGFLDLFLTHPDAVNCLYHNNGDGTFTRVLSGSLVNDIGPAWGCSWGDYDNDGFLDLIVARGIHAVSTNLLFHNNGNSNGWAKFRLIGTVSNRSAIGAKVRVKATIKGRTFWQMREIGCGGDGDTSGGLLEAHFGLGDATNIDLVRIEWPSGIVGSLTNIAPKLCLTVVEHQENAAAGVRFTSIDSSPTGAMKLSVQGQPGLRYLFEASTNLVDWIKIAARTNSNGTVEFVDSKATNFQRRFYRSSAP